MVRADVVWLNELDSTPIHTNLFILMHEISFMDNKVLIGVIAVVAVVAVVGAALAIGGFSDDGDKPAPGSGLVYDGNGGTFYGGQTTTKSMMDTVLRFNSASYPGHTMMSWNTARDGSGTTYMPDQPIDHTKDLVLYAQWGITLECASLIADSLFYPGLSYVVVDEKSNHITITESPAALPPAGKAAVAIVGGSDWSVTDNVFHGTLNGKAVELKFTVEGADSFSYSITGGMPTILLTYDGPVTISH